MAAGCFYITNTYNDFVGNAASGGWSGFAMPSLLLPVKLHAGITNMAPRNRPLRSPFRGNSAHSTGYWWQTAGGIYVGGQLTQFSDGVLTYTSGRRFASLLLVFVLLSFLCFYALLFVISTYVSYSSNHDTCSNPTSGTPAGAGGCYTLSEQRWLRFEDNKVFLSNRGMQITHTQEEEEEKEEEEGSRESIEGEGETRTYHQLVSAK